jgi:hypothetical protein
MLTLPQSSVLMGQQKEKLKRIAIAEPTEAAKDPDFALQGEYEGTGPGGMKVGMQVVAKGAGNFALKGFWGGLPGAGWDGKDTMAGTASTVEGKAQIKMTVGKEAATGTISNGVLTLMAHGEEFSLKRVERTSPTLGAKPPEGAAVLFAMAGDEKNWNGGKLSELSDGKFLGVGVKSKQAFGSFKAHIEFRLPWMPNSGGQQRGNSGFYVQDRYEIQILDSFGLKGLNNECGGIYTQYAPKVNMCFPPMVWQTYDIEFTQAQFDGTTKTKPAKLTVKHNGVVIHDQIELKGPTGGGQAEKPTPGPIQLQNHGDPLVFRNVWVVETK